MHITNRRVFVSLTAIAELLRKPLYVVTAGDLGTDAAQVEKSLGSVLELCQTWYALVLIDEADIFLEARSSHEIQRNVLVCVMLRLLEYYSGCLFLSSNRAAKSVDPAIASRITVMLGYPPSTSQDGPRSGRILWSWSRLCQSRSRSAPGGLPSTVWSFRLGLSGVCDGVHDEREADQELDCSC
jgi:hypothetical protein